MSILFCIDGVCNWSQTLKIWIKIGIVNKSGARMLYNSQDILWRRKLEEQAELQQAIELQNRRLMSLKLLDVRRSNHHRALSTGAVNLSPTLSSNLYSRNAMLSSSDRSSPEFPEGIVP